MCDFAHSFRNGIDSVAPSQTQSTAFQNTYTHTFVWIQRHTMPLVKGNKYNYLILLILKCESAKQIGMVVNLGSRCVCHIMNSRARSVCLPCTIEYIATICKGVVFFRLLVTEKMAVLCFDFLWCLVKKIHYVLMLCSQDT